MKIVPIAIAGIAFVFQTAAAQGTQGPTIEELQTQYLLETGQLRTALGSAQAKYLQLRKEVEELKAKASASPPSDNAPK